VGIRAEESRLPLSRYIIRLARHNGADVALPRLPRQEILDPALASGYFLEDVGNKRLALFRRKVSPERSDEPLSLGELVGLLDHACAYQGPPPDCSIPEGRRFATIEAAYIAAAESPALMRAFVWMQKYLWEDATSRAYGLIEGFWEFLFRTGDHPSRRQRSYP
jgi:hypothetical protein